VRKELSEKGERKEKEKHELKEKRYVKYSNKLGAK
jgi:hypothetical protein